ncbi:hypothetical protein Tco_1457028 [Tanacetum coccineum]
MSDQLHPWKICCPKEIVTKYNTTPEELALNRTKPSSDGKHVSDGLDQLAIKEYCLDIHLIDDHVFTGGIDDEDSNSLDTCNRCK